MTGKALTRRGAMGGLLGAAALGAAATPLPGFAKAAARVPLAFKDPVWNREMFARLEGDKLEAAKKFVAFANSAEGCDVQNATAAPSGPYVTTECTVPDDAPGLIADVQAYFDADATGSALEFLSPIKGPALEQITVEVGSGIRPAADAAALYDEDVKKQAMQLGLPGWE